MRFGATHKAVSYLVAGLGLLSLAIGGILPAPVVILAVVAAAASWWAEEPLISRRSYQQIWTAVLVGLLVITILRVAITGNLIERGVEFAVVLQINRLWNRRDARDYQQIVLLSLVHLIAASVLDQHLAFALVYAGFVITLPWALSLSHLRREIEGSYQQTVPLIERPHVKRILNSRRIITWRFLSATALLSVPMFLMSGLLFVSFPRIGLGLLGGAPRRQMTVAGFSDNVQLGDMGVINDDSTVVMRVELDPQPTPLPPRLDVHWRGAAYDFYDGRGWRRTEKADRRTALDRVGDRYCLGLACRVRGPRQTYRIYLEDLDPPVLLLPPSPVAIIMPPQRRQRGLSHRSLFLSSLMEVRRQPEPAVVVHYSVDTPPSQAVAWSVREADISPYLQLPPLDRRIPELARRITATFGTHPTGKARAVASFLRSSYEYSRDLRGTSNARPLEDFLFHRKAGHCEFFSTAMAVLLRTQGVATRNVTGFVGGRLNRFGGQEYYAVTQSDAHSWVEVYDRRWGWLTFDPTPSASFTAPQKTLTVVLLQMLDATRLAWEKNIIAYDLENQVDFLRGTYLRYRRWRSAADQENEPNPEPRERYEQNWLALAALLVVAFAGGLLVWWRRRNKHGTGSPAGRHKAQAEQLMHLLDKALARHGYPRPPSATPKKQIRKLSRVDHPAAPLAGDVVNRYNQVRFGGAEFAPGELGELRQRIRQIGRVGETWTAPEGDDWTGPAGGEQGDPRPEKKALPPGEDQRT